jgi:uncharacterized protein YndB with AHSA1/START domain
MENSPIVAERVLNAPIAKVWSAISEKDQLSQWSFDIKAFKPEIGFEFSFEGGRENRTYLHRCRVLEVLPGKKLAYSWRYEGYAGNSTVIFELFEEGEKTRIRLTHIGLESFGQENLDFGKQNFEQGWSGLLGESLRNFVE